MAEGGVTLENTLLFAALEEVSAHEIVHRLQHYILHLVNLSLTVNLL